MGLPIGSDSAAGVIMSDAVWDALGKAIHAPPQIVASAGCGMSSGPAGTTWDNGQPALTRLVQITGTLTMGGFYTGCVVYPNLRGLTTSMSAAPTASLGFVNTNQTLDLVNINEFGTSLHLVSSNTYSMATRSGAVDATPSTAQPIWYFAAFPPPSLPVHLVKDGGSNGTYPAGSSATAASYTYTGTYNGTTLFTSQTLTGVRTFAGNTVPATNGFVQVNGIGTNTLSFAILLTDESQPGDVCSTP